MNEDTPVLFVSQGEDSSHRQRFPRPRYTHLVSMGIYQARGVAVRSAVALAETERLRLGVVGRDISGFFYFEGEQMAPCIESASIHVCRSRAIIDYLNVPDSQTS